MLLRIKSPPPGAQKKGEDFCVPALSPARSRALSHQYLRQVQTSAGAPCSSSCPLPPLFIAQPLLPSNIDIHNSFLPHKCVRVRVRVCERPCACAYECACACACARARACRLSRARESQRVKRLSLSLSLSLSLKRERESAR